MNPSEFAAKWSGSQRTERAAAQEQFIDLCRMLGVETPNEADPKGEWYAFEKGAEKSGGGDGFADVWKKGHFAWEYKGKRKDLRAAYQQLLQYREALESPPLLVVSDMDRFEVHTNFTGTTKRVHAFRLVDIAAEPEEPLRVLRAVMKNPEALKPTTSRTQLTEQAAERFAGLASALRDRGHDAHRVAHFLNKLLFCMFAEDAGLLPSGLVERLASNTGKTPDAFAGALRDLFGKMAKSGGLFGVERIEWFNGGLFESDDVLPLTREDIETVRVVSRLDWSEIEPAVFGTLFERGLDPGKRTSLGAHYTDRASIEQIVEPVVMLPLRREFNELRSKVEALEIRQKAGRAASAARTKAEKLVEAYVERLANVRVLDPACGSGNFLYVALQAIKDLEHRVIVWAQDELSLGLFPRVGPEVVRGIEISDYAAELARVTIWIGEIQWMLSHGYAYRRDPVLQPLDNIECRDALLDLSNPALPAEAQWPAAEFIVGNPPFLGRGNLRRSLGSHYRVAMEAVFGDRVPPGSDLCCYWVEKARCQIAARKSRRAGLLATQGIRGGTSRRVLDRVVRSGRIFFAVSDQPWILDGAAVHVSMIGFDGGEETGSILNGEAATRINADLTSGVDLTAARPLRSNRGLAFQGVISSGDFDLLPDEASALLEAPNPSGLPNSDVVRRTITGRDLMGRCRDAWIIDFGSGLTEAEASRYEGPFERVKARVRPVRETSGYAHPDTYPYWQLWNPRVEMRDRLSRLSRYIATARVARHRVFVFLPRDVLPDEQVVAFARDDDYAFGVLQSTIHERWARRKGTQLRDAESASRYTPTSCVETFPFPPSAGGLGDLQGAAMRSVRGRIAVAATTLERLRNGWLSPLRSDGGAHRPAAEEQHRTLTSLYNERPTWLELAHLELDRAVLAAYGWPEAWAEGLSPRKGTDGRVNPALGVADPVVEQDLLGRLLALNLEMNQ